MSLDNMLAVVFHQPMAWKDEIRISTAELIRSKHVSDWMAIIDKEAKLKHRH